MKEKLEAALVELDSAAREEVLHEGTSAHAASKKGDDPRLKSARAEMQVSHRLGSYAA